MAQTGARPWADRTFLREVQYQTDVNLAARQSMYAYQHPPVNLMSRTLDLAGPAGREVVADVGCGNGLYLAELARRGHAGRSCAGSLARADECWSASTAMPTRARSCCVPSSRL